MEKSFFNNSGMVMHEGGDHSSSGLSSWTKRNYTCSFCKRQFNTAQALGGHMNVHRRDRARLRQLPSWVFQNPNPNSSSSSSTSLPSCNSPNPTCRTNHHSFPSPLPHRESNSPIINSEPPHSENECFQIEEISIKKKSKVGLVDEGIFINKGFARKYEMEKHIKKHELISLELEIGCKDPNDVLDLELRLGYF